MSVTNYSCGRCPSGGFSNDMTRTEVRLHAAMQHNVVVRTPIHMLALSIAKGTPLMPNVGQIKVWDDSRPRKDYPVEVIQPMGNAHWTASNGQAMDFLMLCRRISTWVALGLTVDVEPAETCACCGSKVAEGVMHGGRGGQAEIAANAPCYSDPGPNDGCSEFAPPCPRHA